MFGGPQVAEQGGGVLALAVTNAFALAFGMSETPLSLAIGGIGTFTRASAATVTDWEGIVRPVKSGEIRMAGWRRVENLNPQSEADSQWVANGTTPPTVSASVVYGGKTAVSVTFPAGVSGYAGSRASGSFATIITAHKYQSRLAIAADRPLTGAEQLRVLYTGAHGICDQYFSNSVNLSTSWKTYSTATPSTANASGGDSFTVFPVTNLSSPITVYMTERQFEDVTARSNQTPSEYVSTGVLSAPYHGFGADGVRYFTTTNGNTVDGNGVVTEAAGVPLHPTYTDPNFGIVWATYKPWAASESTLSLGSRRVPSQNLFPAGGNGYWYYVSTFVGASTGATEPTWPTTIGATVVDATGNTWTNGGYYRIAGYLAEPQRTNLGRRGNDPTNATYWANTDVTPTLNSVQSPDGATNSTLITEGSAGTAIAAQSVKTVSAGSRQALGVWLKRGNTDWVEVGVRNTGATNGFRAWVNLATGVVGTANTFGTATNEAAYIEMQSLNSHWRVVLVGKLAAGDTTAQLYVRSASANGTSTRVNGATYYLYCMQHVASDSITSDIVNDGDTDVTRSADALTYSAASALDAKAAVLAMFASEYGRASTVLAAGGVIGRGSQGIMAQLAASGDPTNRTAYYDGTTAGNISSGASVSAIAAYAVRWNTDAKAFRNNTASAGTAFDGTFGSGAIEVGNVTGPGSVSGIVRSAVILGTPPSDVVIQAATQWHNL